MMDYLTWHYSTAYRDLLRAWLNYMWFVAHFFSLGILLRTFFSPFKRNSEKNNKGLDIEAILEVLAVNLIMRLVGILIRTVLIAIGLAVLAVVTTGGLAAILIWTLLPGFLIALLLVSIFGWDQLLSL